MSRSLALLFLILLQNVLSMTVSTTKDNQKALRTLVTQAAQHEIESDDLDLQGIVWLEHINLVVGDQNLAKYFYIRFLGFTPDDSTKSFHINLGQQQFHLAETGDSPQIVAGEIALTVPSLTTLRERIPPAMEALKGTEFNVQDNDDCMRITCPWGNRFSVYDVLRDAQVAENLPKTLTARKMENLHAIGGAYGTHRMAVRGKAGIRYVQIDCPYGKSSAIARFYREILGCAVQEMESNDDQGSPMRTAIVSVGPGVHLVFLETEQVSAKELVKNYQAMEGVHVCFYANDFKALYQRLAARNLIWTNPRFVHLDTCDTWQEAKASRTLRFKDIVDLETNEKILELEHETRPLRHGQYLKAPNYEPK